MSTRERSATQAQFWRLERDKKLDFCILRTLCFLTSMIDYTHTEFVVSVHVLKVFLMFRSLPSEISSSIYIRIFFSNILYSFFLFFRSGHIISCALPIPWAIQGNTSLSATHVHARPPSARTNMKILKPADMVVSCIRLANQAAGSNSIYTANKDVTITVTMNGTAENQY